MDIDLKLADPSVQINDDVPLWRYVDLPKFLDLLTTESLKMPHASSMEDAYEGMMAPGAIAGTIAKDLADGAPGYFRHARINKIHKDSLFLTHRTYISCWTAFPSENAGLWRLYGDEKGVAIRTTWGSLRNSLAGTADCVRDVFYGKVDYRSAQEDDRIPQTYTDQYFIKRREFSHENEFRLVAHDESREHKYNEPSLEGLPRLATLPCDLNTLVEEVVVSPRLGEWVWETVKAVSHTYGGNWNVTHSRLYQPPPDEIMDY
ncbi:DUF2971 domain-containing protein [Microbacterium sp. LWO12-1.2]|uniref:DUF2971 domain-containing protein n=1 Tax=Microbacterium sp. LWO12-1.2 TaxID=3135261 RepID=UPI0034454B06